MNPLPVCTAAPVAVLVTSVSLVRRVCRFGSLLLAGLILSSVLSSAATAATLTVSSLADSGAGSLRATLAAAASGDVIEFEPSLFEDVLPKTITLTSGELLVTRSLSIIGPGDSPAMPQPMLAISGNGTSRALHVVSPGASITVTISGLTIKNGRGYDGGGVLVEKADLSLIRCDIVDNIATHHGGGLNGRGGSMVTLDECLIARNTSADDGGGVALDHTTLTARRTLVESNNASDQGGGIYDLYAPLTLENTTVSANTSAKAAGIYVNGDGYTACDSLLSACTVTLNDANSDTGGIQVYGRKTTVHLASTIVAKNILSPAGKPISQSDLLKSSCGLFVSDDYNLIRSPGSSEPSAAAHDRIGSTFDPKLDALAYHGGRTRTHSLQTGSQALDYVPAAFLPATVMTDQRGDGFPRVAGSPTVLAEIGAFESQPPQVQIVTPALYAECTGATTSVVFAFRVIDLDGDVRSVVIKDGNGAEIWNAGSVTIPAGTDGTTFHATIQVPRAVQETSSFSVVATDPLYSGSASASVTLIDTTPPVVTLTGPDAITLECGTPFTDPGATALDLCDGPLPVKIDPSGFMPGAIGLTMLTYSATDNAGHTATAIRMIKVVDTTPPAIRSVTPATYSWEGTDPNICGFLADGTSFAPAVNVTDVCDPTPTTSFKLALPGGGFEPLTLAHVFPIGSSTVYAFATDASGNVSAPAPIAVSVIDKAPPSIALAGSDVVTLDLGASFVDPGVTTVENCDGSVVVTRTVNGSSSLDVNPCYPGPYVIVYTASDAAGNQNSVTRTVNVVHHVAIAVAPAVSRDVDPGTCAATLDLTKVVAITGLALACDSVVINVQVTLPDGSPAVPAFGSYSFPHGTSHVAIQVVARDTATNSSEELASALFDVVVSDPYNSCTENVAWPLAIDLPLTPVAPGSTMSTGDYEQYIAQVGESRWYKFQGLPGSHINVELTNLPANYDLVVYSDISAAYDSLVALIGSTDEADKILAILGAQSSPEAYSPEAYSPEAYSPEAYSPEAYSPEAYSPEAYSPEAYSRKAYAPEAYSPEAYSPEAYSPEAYSPEAYSRRAYSPEAYASAQLRSLVAFSASPGTSGEAVRFNTFSRSGLFYIRVRGQNGTSSTKAPFTLSVSAQQDVCNGVSDLNTTPAATPTIAGSPTSLIVWDSTRIVGTSVEKSALATALTAFASAANAAVVDVGDDARVIALNAQADASPACPVAKNLVAETIRHIIAACRATKPSISDVTLVGNDNVIPFFRTNDNALLASEESYFPPVYDNTQSQSSLRLAQVLTQDRYGSDCQVTLATGPFDLPDVPVGRLVETASEVGSYLDTYRKLFDGTVSSGGVLPTPHSLFVSGYDFLTDSAEAVRDQFSAGLGGGATLDQLIAANGLAPSLGWTADMFKASFLGTHHDIAYLAGHFSTSGALAADYTTRVTAGDMLASPVNLDFSLLLSTGCHSGYNTVDGDAVPGVTEQPDWSQAFSRKHALWIAGTGYQYGDTDFIEYSERLYLKMAEELRTGSGPIAIGQALISAKKLYLQETAMMRGIHEKSLLEMTLYGLPMVKLNLPGSRLASIAPTSDVGATSPVSGPGATFGLHVGTLSTTPELTPKTSTLTVVGETGSTVTVSHLEGPNGIVTLPGEPVRPLASFNVTRPEGLVRGVGFRSGTYQDVGGYQPLTGAPATEIRGVHGDFYTEVFYPAQTWNVNHLGLFCGLDLGTKIDVFPAQFISDAPGSSLGTSRQFSSMDFSVYYCADTTTAALTNPPAINLVSSGIDGADITFSVQVGGIVSVGVQEVWITYTGAAGSFHGSWQSLTLTPPADPSYVGTWTGRLVGAAGEAANLRFIVQAVNGIGAIALNTNFGHFFRAGQSTADATGTTPSFLTLLAPVPTSGAYRQIAPMSAKLTDGTGPLVGRLIAFRVGPLAAYGTTDTNGVASAQLTLAATPDTYALDASFAGDANYLSSNASAPLQITKQATNLTFAVPANPLAIGDAVVTLVSADGTPLKEKTVAFLVTAGNATTAVAEITDGAGQARITHAVPTATNYTLAAYFGTSVALPDGTMLSLSDTLYGPALASSTFSVVPPNALLFANEKVLLVYGDKKAPGSSVKNPGLSEADINANLRFSDASFDPATILALPSAKKVTAHLKATLQGKLLVEGEVSLSVWGASGTWAGTANVGGVSALLGVTWLPPSFDSLNSDAAAPRVTSTTIAPALTLLAYTPVAGTYTTTIGSGAGQALVTVKNGKVTKITGGYSSRCQIRSTGKSAIVALPFALGPGGTVVTAGSVNSTVTVTPGVNYFRTTGVMIAHINPPTGSGPLFNISPTLLQFELQLGSGPHEHPVAGQLVVGDAARPWTTENSSTRIRNAP